MINIKRRRLKRVAGYIIALSFHRVNYALSIPISFKDPTGFAPEKEENELQGKKDCDKLMVMEYITNWELDGDYINYYIEEFSSSMRIGREYVFCRRINYSMDRSLSRGFGKLLDSGGGTGGGGGGSGRTGKTVSNNGTVTLTQESKNIIKENISIYFSPSLNPEEAQAAVQAFWTNLFEGLTNNVSKENYEFLTTADLTVVLLSIDDFKDYAGDRGYKDVAGFCLSANDANRITLCADYIINGLDNYFDKPSYSYNPIPGLQFEKSYSTNYTETIMHEFGHGFAYWKIGSDYNSYNAKYRENWAIWYCNTNYRQKVGRPDQVYNSTFWISIFINGHNPYSEIY